MRFRANIWTSVLAGIAFGLALGVARGGAWALAMLPLFVVLAVFLVIGLPQFREINRWNRREDGSLIRHGLAEVMNHQELREMVLPAWLRMGAFSLLTIVSLLVTTLR